MSLYQKQRWFTFIYYKPIILGQTSSLHSLFVLNGFKLTKHNPEKVFF